MKKIRTILFAYDCEEDIKVKMSWLIKYLGKENICDAGITYPISELTVKCTKKQWKVIRFKLDLAKVYV